VSDSSTIQKNDGREIATSEELLVTVFATNRETSLRHYSSSRNRNRGVIDRSIDDYKE